MTTPALIAAIALIAAPPEEGFCPALKAVVAAAPGGFQALNPHQAWAGLETWAVDTQLDQAAMNCAVTTLGGPRHYRCMSPQWSEPGSSDAREMAERVQACLGVTMAGSGDPAVNGDEYTAQVSGADVRISYDLIITHGADQAYHSYYLALRITPRRD